DAGDHHYKSLKTLLDGGIAMRPKNLLFYATSNRRHLMERSMIENETSTAIHPSEAVEEKISLSDRFGLWIGFHHIDQSLYLNIIETYLKAFDIESTQDEWRSQALEWAITRGHRSGRSAWQFVLDFAGKKSKILNIDTIV
ncbi:MAG: DUF815 domain-containing protein, partial [Pseudomonadota bacterium]